MEIQWETLAGTAGSGALLVAILKHFVVKAVNQLERVSTDIAKVNSSLASIEVRLRQLDKIQDKVAEHERKIVELQSRFKYERKPVQGFDYPAVSQT